MKRNLTHGTEKIFPLKESSTYPKKKQGFLKANPRDWRKWYHILDVPLNRCSTCQESFV